MSTPTPPAGNPWLTFSRKMKWVLLGTVVALLGTAGTELTNTFPISDHPWVAIILAALPFVAGYIPKETKP